MSESEDIGRAAVDMLLRRRESFTARDLDTFAGLLHIDSVHLVNTAWDLVEDGRLTYDATARFRAVNR